MATEQTAQTARAEAGAVAGTVKEETKNVAQEAQQQATQLRCTRCRTTYGHAANEEATKFAQTLHDTSQQLQSMAGAAGGDGVASSLVQEGASATERLAIAARPGRRRGRDGRRPLRLLAAGRVRSCSAQRRSGSRWPGLVRNLSGDNASATPSGNGSGTLAAGIGAGRNELGERAVSPTPVTGGSE